MKLAVYVSPHGYGHATRVAEVLCAVEVVNPVVDIHLRTAAPRFLFSKLNHVVSYAPVSLDPGARESDVLTVDIAATRASWETFITNEAAHVASEVAWLRATGIDLVFYDASPLAAEIAAVAGIPSIGMSNFTWDFILGDSSAAEHLRRQYAKTTQFLRLPLSHEMPAFPVLHDVPLVAAKAVGDREEMRKSLGLGRDDVALLIGLRGNAIDERLAKHYLSEIRIFSFGECNLAGAKKLGPEWAPRFTEVLHACDALLSKIGYGVVAECIANDVPLLHLPRSGFSETPVIMGSMGEWLVHREVSDESLVMREAILQLRAQSPPSRCDCNGADVVAAEIISVGSAP